MRTTLTLEDDVSARLRQEMRRTGGTLKQVVNDCLRRGFQAKRRDSAKPFKARVFAAGPPPGMTFDNVEELIDHLEGPGRA